MTTPDEPEWLTRAEATDRASISPRTLDRWFDQNILTRYTDGAGRVRVSAVELDDVLTPRPAADCARTA